MRSEMLGTETTIKNAVTRIQPRTEGVRVGWEVRVGRDSTGEEAVWVYVLVPDDRIDEFYDEWDKVREDIRQRVREQVGNPDAFVYIRMQATSEVDAGT
jgi:hypothetical protein